MGVSGLAGRESALASLDPDKIYVENVRSLLDVRYETALGLCEAAVRQGFFQRRVEVLCPDGAVGASAETEAELPPAVRCWSEADGHFEETYLPTAKLAKVIAYRLNDDVAARLYGPTA